jgi:hypothetical protein
MKFEESNLGLNLDVDLQYVPTFSESVDGNEVRILELRILKMFRIYMPKKV